MGAGIGAMTGTAAGIKYARDNNLNPWTGSDKTLNSGKYLGNDPAKAPKGFEWKGKPNSTPGSEDGNWYNPKTGETLRPDLKHPDPIGPHWDWRDPAGKWWRIFPDGTKTPK